MSDTETAPGLDPDVIWSPDAERIESANITRLMRKAGIEGLEELRARALDPEWFWPAVLEDLELEFAEPWTEVVDTSDGIEWSRWFPGAKTNIASLCLDRWAESKGGAEALTWESERGERRTMTWTELRSMSERLAGGLRSLGIGERDTVGIFMPMAPETVAALHACAKLGAIAVPMFSGYGAGAVATRLADAEVKVLISADGFPRAGKEVPMKETAEAAIASAGTDTKLVVWHRLGRDAPRSPGEVDWDELLAAEPVDSQLLAADHPLLLVYTSGTTGRPKGAVLSHAGVLASIAKDAAYHVDIKASDSVCWVTDIGWIMGPWTIVAAGSTGARLCLVEGSPTAPTKTRLWELVEREGITMLGVSPSLTRGLMAAGAEAEPKPGQLRTLRTIGATGEPMSPEAYVWLAERVGEGRCPIINISGGTEVGGAFLAPLPIQELKVSSLGGPGLGMDVGIVDEEGNEVEPGEVGQLVCRASWPAMTMGLWKDPARFLETYWRVLPGVWVHGDWASVDADGQWFLHGRSDDTLNIAGQRIGPTEIEAALIAEGGVADAAAIPVPHEIKGEELWCFAVPSGGTELDTDALAAGVAARVGKPFKPSRIVIVETLPRTKTGKTLRRVVRAVALGKDPGDLSTLEDEGAIEALRAGMAG
jgi:acetyl-CoA synthetase